MSITNLLAVQPGEYVKEIEATVSDAKALVTKSNKTFFKALLTDGQHKAYATSFGQTFEHVNGKRVKFSGMSIKRGDDFNNTPQVTIGDKAKWIVAGEGAIPNQQSANPTTSTVNAKTPAVVSQNPPRVNAVEGVTVGMAVNKSVDLFLRTTQAGDPIDLEAAGLWIHKCASMLIRLSHNLQAGHLAAPLHKKVESTPPPEQPSGKDEDVPF